MFETILLTVALVAILALLIWGAGYIVCSGDWLTWLLCGDSLCNLIAAVLTALANVLTGSDS